MSEQDPRAAQFKDLRGYKCPMNYVHTRLLLSDLPPGAVLEVWVDDGEPAESVPASLKRDGYVIQTTKALAPGLSILVKNKS
jgi:TusA-related sulfurtransferase